MTRLARLLPALLTVPLAGCFLLPADPAEPSQPAGSGATTAAADPDPDPGADPAETPADASVQPATLLPLNRPVTTQTTEGYGPYALEGDRWGLIGPGWQWAVEPVYWRLSPCLGADGRPTYWLGGGETATDILDAAGAKIGEIPDPAASCYAGDQYAIVGDRSQGMGGTGIFSLTGMRFLLGPDDGLFISGFDDATAVVAWDAGFDYSSAQAFFDVTTGELNYLPEGARVSSYYPIDWPVPAFLSGSGDDLVPFNAKAGFVGRDGQWVADAPRYAYAEAFSGGLAVVSEDGVTYHLVDTSFTQVGADYVSLYALAGPDRRFGYRGRLNDIDTELLDTAGRLIGRLTDAEACSPVDAASVTCPVTDPATGTRQLVTLPSGERTDLPDPYAIPLSDTVVATADGTQVLNLATGDRFAVPAPYSVTLNGTMSWYNAAAGPFTTAYYSGYGGTRTLSLVLDATGAVTPFRSVSLAFDDSGDYFLAEAGADHGYIDAAGRWLFRESIYMSLED
jgi:hypothetical protein